ncbi:MAG TPA: carbohydrate ABC transporter permease [Chloroflexota bacterium]|nr:carbohydrate ABC transporter permease [Chloroflexota bacterium]
MTRHRHRLARVAIWTVIVLLLIVFLFPIYWIVTTSLKRQSDVITLPPDLLFFHPTLDNYLAVIQGTTTFQSAVAVPDFTADLFHSLLIGLASTGLALLLGTPAAYSLARFRFRGRALLALAILATRILPPLGILVPVFVLYGRIHLIDTYQGLIVLYLSFSLSLVIWMMRGFIGDVPAALEECAMVDGADRLQAMMRITLPLVAPGLAATAILSLLFNWNEFLFAVTLTTQTARTAPVAASLFLSSHVVVWGNLSAACVLIAGPIFLFALLVQRHLVRGLVSGAVRE